MFHSYEKFKEPVLVFTDYMTNMVRKKVNNKV